MTAKGIRDMAYRNKTYVEHVAFRVKDIQWHIRFFRDVLGMPVKETDGPADAPRQAWTVGGVQLIADPAFEGPEGRFGHLGMMTEDVEGAIAAASQWGVGSAPQGRNWLLLPDGLIVELNQGVPGAVDQALAVKPKG
jgi:catechol 2,3-dioxygenase-like lactoylglutathione lyase family enzyme